MFEDLQITVTFAYVTTIPAWCHCRNCHPSASNGDIWTLKLLCSVEFSRQA